MPPLKVINLDRQPDRWESFRAANPHLSVERVSAADGRALTRETFRAQGLITPDNGYSIGALACALSHLRLWREASEGGGLTIAEDDAILHPAFDRRAGEALGGLGEWDVVLWGWNLDWPALVEPAPGLPPMLLRSRDDPPPYEPGEFRRAEVKPAMSRVLSAAGTLCYSISPEGAARLLEASLPLAGEPAPCHHMPDRLWGNTGLDVEMSRHYPWLRAYACFPPLAFSPNDWEGSAIRPNRTNAEA